MFAGKERQISSAGVGLKAQGSRLKEIVDISLGVRPEPGALSPEPWALSLEP
jgi:hypothetical protein